MPSYSANPGWAGTYGPPFLPRPASTFTDAAFSPFSPILPVPLNQPPPGESLPDPRREQYPVSWNLPVGVPGSEGLKLASFQTLQTLADLYSVARACIQQRKAEIRGLDWDVVLTKDAEKQYKGDAAAMRDFGERQDAARKFFRRPDPDYWTFDSWLDDLLEQVFVFDALSLFLQPVRGKGMRKGLLGSDLDCLQLIDGQTIRPLYDVNGGSPAPPAPAVQQYLWGVPRADFTDVLSGRDLENAGLTEAEWRPFTRDQLLYLPMNRRRWTPYGLPPVERALIPIMTGLQKQGFQLDYFREGTVPACYVSPGDSGMTPNQVRELQDALNAIAGDPAWHHKIIVLPPGSKTMPQKDAQLADDFDAIVMTQVCMAFDVKPMELGILPQVSTLASPFAAREASQASRAAQQRTSTRPLLKFLSGIFDGILQNVCGQHDLRFVFSGMDEVQDQAAMTDMLVKQVQSGLRSIDEARDDLGLTPWGFDETSDPVVFTPAGPIPLTAATAIAQAQALGMGGAEGTGESSTVTPLSGAHSAAQGARAAITGSKPPRLSSPGKTGRPGSVVQRQASRGGRLAPTHAQGTGAPGRATGKPAPKAAMAELAALGRHLRKGRDLSTWQPVHLEPHILSAVRGNMAMGLSPDEAVTVVAEVFKATGGQAVPPFGQPPSQPPPPLTIQQLIATYGPQIAAAFAAAVAAAALLIAAWIAGTLAVTAAVLAAMILADLRKYLGPVLAALWQAAWGAAVAEAEAQAGPVPDEAQMRRDLEAFLATEGETWLDRISGTREQALIQAIKDALAAGDPEAVVAELERILGVSFRIDLITLTEVMRAWNAGGAQALKLLGVMQVRWTVHSGNPCPKCLKAQAAGPLPLGSIFPGTLLPAPPSHPRCMCSLMPVIATPPATKALTRHVSDNGEVFWAEQDAPELNPAGGGALLHPYPHNIDGGPVPGGTVGPTAGGEPPRWDGSQPFAQACWIEGGDDADQGTQRGTGSRPGEDWPAPYMDGYWPEGGLGTAQPPASAIPGDENDRGRAPNPVGKAADAASVLAKAPKAKASAVFRQMSDNYPQSSIAWIKRIRWVGPVEVPLEDIDWSSEERWAAHHQQDKVDHFAAQLQAGQKVDPAVGIIQPGEHHIRIVDGHHRSLACRHIGWPSRMYVGFVTDAATAHDALETHLYQVHQGDDPANKSFTAGALGIPGAVSGLTPLTTQPAMPNTPEALRKVSKKAVNYRPATSGQRCDTCVMWRPGRCTLVRGDIAPDATCDRWYPRDATKSADGPHVAGLMVRAADTGRVLMLQRAITEDDPAAGRWEPPGGHQEPGETLLAAAMREFSEETGANAPQGALTGSWDASNGIYRGFVLTVPSEDSVDIFGGRDQWVDPDDPHGDHRQAIAWFDPAQFRDNPSMRDEMAADLDRVLEALSEPVEKAGHGGDAETLREYWTHQAHPGPTRFAYAEQIKWGTPGDFMRCVNLVKEHGHMDDEQAKGYCNLLHHRALGYWPAQHARMVREGEQ